MIQETPQIRNRTLIHEIFFIFPFLGTILACLDPNWILNPDPPTNRGGRSADTTSRGRQCPPTNPPTQPCLLSPFLSFGPTLSYFSRTPLLSTKPVFYPTYQPNLSPRIPSVNICSYSFVVFLFTFPFCAPPPPTQIRSQSSIPSFQFPFVFFSFYISFSFHHSVLST